MAERNLFNEPEINTQPIGDDALPAGEPRPHGRYFTPDLLALACARTVASLIPKPRHVFEPGCGGGAFLRAARTVWPDADLLGVDLVPVCDGPGTVLKRDLFEVRGAKWDLILGNPDFGIAERVVRHCMKNLAPAGHLALLLRISFLASQARVPLYREHPLFAFGPIAGRPSFTGGGTDPSEYGLFVWARRHDGPTGRLLPPLEWKR